MIPRYFTLHQKNLHVTQTLYIKLLHKHFGDPDILN